MTHLAVNRLVEQLRSGSTTERHDAALKLGLLLEKHAVAGSEQSTQEALLGPELFAVKMCDADIQSLLREVGEVIGEAQLEDEIKSTLAWALGKSFASKACDIIADQIQQDQPKSEEFLYQMVVALDNFYSVGIVEKRRLADLGERLRRQPVSMRIKELIDSWKPDQKKGL